jgi:hypothetical protein
MFLSSAFDDRLLYRLVGNGFLRREVAIRLTFGQEFSRRLAMLIGVVGLEDDPFVVVETEPRKTFKDRACRFIRRASEIRVFDTKQELAAGLPGVEIVIKRGAGRTDVQIARR